MARFFRDTDKGRSRHRLIVMVIVGACIAVIVGFTTAWWYAPVAGWAGACLLYIVWVWMAIGRLNPADTQAHATREDPGSTISEFLVLVTSVASLAAVVVLLVRAHNASGLAQASIAALALGSVALSWTMIHTLYTLRYARVYYSDPIGGIDFNNPDEPPRYVDFAYLSFDLGMTFQVSDTSLRTSELRGIVLRHTLLSYLFGSVVLATTINLVAGIGS